jgi:hypothetical protein
MTSVLLLVASAWLTPEPGPWGDDAFEAPSTSASASARWLPRLTLRFTRRAADAWWADSLRDALTTPLGTTFEVRLEWGADAASD